MSHYSLSIIALAAAAGVAQAQDACTACRKSVSGVIGFGVATLPRYAGSSEYRTLPMPVVQLEYKGRLYLGGSQSGVGGGIGAYVVRGPAVSWQVELSGAEARPEGRGDALAGMGRRSAASYAGTAVVYRTGFMAATAGVAFGLGNDQGSYGTVGLSTERPLARRWVGGLSTGATLADSRNMAFEFGVTDEQSARRRVLIAGGDARLDVGDGNSYSPKAGLKDVRGSASLAYLLTDRSRAIAFAQATRLSNEAARSPLVRDRNGGAAGMALAYSF